MSLALGLMAVVLVGDGSPGRGQGDGPIVQQVAVLEMDGVDWRGPLYFHMKPVGRQGAVTAWTASTATAQGLMKRAEPCTVFPRLVTSGSRAKVEIQNRTHRYVAAVRRVADGPPHEATEVAVVPEVDFVPESFCATLASRRAEGGIATDLTVDDCRFLALHTASASDSVKGRSPLAGNNVAFQMQVPEMATSHAQGHWVIPDGDVLIVSLGTHSVADPKTKAEKVRERLVVVMAGEPDHSAPPAPSADPRPKAAEIPVGYIPPAPLTVPAPPVPEASSPLTVAGRAVLVVPFGPIVLPARPPAPEALTFDFAFPSASAPRPMPALPSRSLPQGYAADGTLASLPPLPEEPRPTTADTSAEPRPSAQARHIPGHRPDADDSCPAAGEVLARATDRGKAAAEHDEKAGACCATSPAPRASTACDRQAIWELTLPEALTIAFENVHGLRLVNPNAHGAACSGQACSDGPCCAKTNPDLMVVAPLGQNTDIRFKAEAMALARSVEQQYWALAQQQVKLWATQTAVELGEQILKREKGKFEVCSGSIPNVAEAEQQLERFRLDYISVTADLIATERGLRNILGLPPADNRRIVPVTAPTEAELEPDWDACLAQMKASQPDILRHEALARVAAFQAAIALACGEVGGAAEPPTALVSFMKQRTLCQQVMHQTTHSLARRFIEIDANYKQFKKAGELKVAALKRLEAQRVFYENGTITIDRYLDAVNRWANAVAQEADFRSRYNTSIAALEEVKGTLLDGKVVAVARRAHPAPAPAPKADPETTRAVLEPLPNRSYADIVTQVEEGPTGELKVRAMSPGTGLLYFDAAVPMKQVEARPATVRVPLADGAVMEIRATVVRPTPGEK
jgi:hypothetical protein